MSIARSTRRNHPVPHPFLKWAGGKGQLLPELQQRVALAEPFQRYHEPFVGAGALFFDLYRSERLKPDQGQQAFLSDSNIRLMETYLGLRDHTERVMRLLAMHQARHDKEYYYAVRAELPEGLAARAARIIYLNRTCFNGLFRENRRGEFNVPMGAYINPRICDETNHQAVAQALQGVWLDVAPFETVLERAKAGDLVYFDPPYHPLSRSASFTKYNKDDFNEDDQRRLAEVFATLTDNGVKVLLSNSMTPLIQELYGAYTFETVQATRNVNSRADRRGKIDEALVRNF